MERARFPKQVLTLRRTQRAGRSAGGVAVAGAPTAQIDVTVNVTVCVSPAPFGDAAAVAEAV